MGRRNRWSRSARMKPLLCFLVATLTGLYTLNSQTSFSRTDSYFKSTFPHSSLPERCSTACRDLAIGNITRVEMLERRKHDSGNWTVGHFPHQSCEENVLLSQRKRKPAPAPAAVVITTVIDISYIDILPEWAAKAREARAACFVVAIDEEVCVQAERNLCGCLDVEPADNEVGETSSSKGWHKNRVESVRRRFEGALFILEHGMPVLMHDADVFFTSGFKKIMSFVTLARESGKVLDVMVQDNGARDTAFDGLNWGFVWLNPTNFTKNLLHCTLARWNDAAFGCPPGPCNSYYKRSQPRINHVLELGLGNNVGGKVCKLPALKRFGAKHMTGYPNAAAKLACAKADGLLSKELPSKRYRYIVPRDASVEMQRRALQITIALANKTSSKVVIPDSYRKLENTKICDIFDLSNVGSFLTMPTSEKCTHVVRFLDDVLLHRQTAEHPAIDALICLDFKLLIELDATRAVEVNDQILSIPICNPNNPVYDKFHSCYRKDGTDESFRIRIDDAKNRERLELNSTVYGIPLA